MATAIRTRNQEYTNFTFQEWQGNESWVALMGDQESSELQACDYFWLQVEDRVLAEVDKLRIEGWQPVEAIGPQAIKLRKSQSIDFSINPADVLLWFMTFGIALVMQLIMNAPRRYVTYRPVEVRIRMCRLNERQLFPAA